MPNQEHTRLLLRECVSGADMCISVLNEILPKIQNTALKHAVSTCIKEHAEAKNIAQNMLFNMGDHGKKISAFAKGMAYMKTNISLSVDHSDHSVCRLVEKGCDTGVRSLEVFLKQFPHADRQAVYIARELIESEQKLSSKTKLHL